MDAHLVGYGSSSEDEGKTKKHDKQVKNLSSETVQMKPSGRERNFRKRSVSPEKEGLPKHESERQDVQTSINNQDQTQRSEESKTNESPVEQKPSVSKLQTSPDRKKNRDSGKKSRSRSRSSSLSSDKESRSAVDEFGRHIRRQHSARSKDEDRSSKDKRRYSRDQRKSRSRSRSKERDRGFRRRESHDSSRRRNDDRYKGRRDRRWSGDGSRERTRDWSKERNRNRSPKRSRSRERSPVRKSARLYLGGPERKPPIVPGRDKVTMSSEEIEKKLAARAESLKQVAQATATNLNLPSYLNPSVVNPQLYAKQQEKRKLLWSSKKAEQVPSDSNAWAGTRFTGDQDGEMKAKFRRLMGIKGAEGATAEPSEEDVSSKGDRILTDLEAEFERSRAFQLSRGAGGKSGIGLGYASANYNAMTGIQGVNSSE